MHKQNTPLLPLLPRGPEKDKGTNQWLSQRNSAYGLQLDAQHALRYFYRAYRIVSYGVPFSVVLCSRILLFRSVCCMSRRVVLLDSYAVFTRDTFAWGKLNILLYCVTFSIVKWYLPHVTTCLVSMSRVNTALVVYRIARSLFSCYTIKFSSLECYLVSCCVLACRIVSWRAWRGVAWRGVAWRDVTWRDALWCFIIIIIIIITITIITTIIIIFYYFYCTPLFATLHYEIQAPWSPVV